MDSKDSLAMPCCVVKAITIPCSAKFRLAGCQIKFLTMTMFPLFWFEFAFAYA